MKSPGITIRPVLFMDGSHQLNEIFLDDVRVPARNRVGKENDGWRVSNSTSNFERSMVATYAFLRRQLDELTKLCKESKWGGEVLAEKPLVRDKLAELAIEIDVGNAFCYLVVWRQSKGDFKEAGLFAATVKVVSSELIQQFFHTACEILGMYGQVDDSRWAPLQGRFEKGYQVYQALTIGGGTSEVMRNMIASMALGLPRSW